MLSDRDLIHIKTFALKIEGNLTRSQYLMMRTAYATELSLDSEYLLYRRMDALSGLQAEIYDCCIESCIAFLGDFEDLRFCPYCKEPRYDSKKNPRARFWYLPIFPRLEGLFRNERIAQTLTTYRSEYKTKHGEISDIFDSDHYKELRTKNVVIEGEEAPYKYFDQPTDIALGMSTDGVSLFKTRKHFCTATPVISINYSFPPEVRNRFGNIEQSLVIPGPKSPKDFNSFMVPLEKEAIAMARGKRIWNAYTKAQFILRCYYIRAFGDMVAMLKVLYLKGHNGIRPCRCCMIMSSNDADSGVTHYYPAHVMPVKANQRLKFWDPSNLDARTHELTLKMLEAINAQSTKTASERLMMVFGITGTSFIFRMPGMDLPRSTPYDSMHMIINIVTMFMDIGEGDFGGIDHSREAYVIPNKTWKTIAKELKACSRTIPSKFVRSMPDLLTERSSFTAESWTFWMMYLAPILLVNRLPEPYYSHFVRFGEIWKLALQLTITTKEIKKLEDMIIEWVFEYERYAYL